MSKTKALLGTFLLSLLFISSQHVTAADRSFNLNSVQISTAQLGDFPYFGLPAGYEFRTRPVSRDQDRFPFWVGDRVEWVEGRLWVNAIRTEKGKQFSPFELEKNIDAVITTAGGVKVFEGKLPREMRTSLQAESFREPMSNIFHDAYSRPTRTYLLRRNDKNIWVYLNAASAMSHLVVVETSPFEVTASLLPATDMKRQLDATGKVSLQVNFATDKTDILPESQPQIEQVVQLLRDDPALKLSVNGHTDTSGTAAHNQQLSEGRAQSVVAALIAKGINASRLIAKGFGQNAPIADNSTEEGRAKNRRVELVKM
jgi:outer membrane protein OmpA-like peptidoglycan-associated protein